MMTVLRSYVFVCPCGSSRRFAAIEPEKVQEQIYREGWGTLNESVKECPQCVQKRVRDTVRVPAITPDTFRKIAITAGGHYFDVRCKDGHVEDCKCVESGAPLRKESA